jgi:hypothetical protein
MKPAFPAYTLALSCCMLMANPANLALAHTESGSLGVPAEATDFYQVSCTDDGNGVPASMVAQVINRSAAPAPYVSVVVHRGVAATNTTDATAGDAVASPLVNVNGGDGVYNVFVSKAGPGAESYTLTFHCMTGTNGSGIHTGTTSVFRQNQ